MMTERERNRKRGKGSVMTSWGRGQTELTGTDETNRDLFSCVKCARRKHKQLLQVWLHVAVMQTRDSLQTSPSAWMRTEPIFSLSCFSLYILSSFPSILSFTVLSHQQKSTRRETVRRRPFRASQTVLLSLLFMISDVTELTTCL